MGVGAMLGAGIFALLGVVGLVAGKETYISFLLGGVVAILSGYTYGKRAARYPMRVGSPPTSTMPLVQDGSRAPSPSRT